MKVKLQLSWRHQFQFAGYYAALEKGFYKEAGLDVVLIEGGPGTQCDEKKLKAVNYCNAPGSVVKLRAEGQAIVVLASIIQHSPIVLITRKNSKLYTPHDLIGKRVEMLVSGQVVPEIHAMFQNEGVKLNQIFQKENSVDISALSSGKADAIYGFMSNEPYQLRKAGIDFHIIHPRKYGIDFYGDNLITSEAEIKHYPKRVEAFREASLRGWRYAMKHQEEIVDLILEKYASSKTRESLLAEARNIEKLMYSELIEIGHINPGRWKHTADTLVSLGLIDKDYSLEGFIYDSERKRDYLKIIRWLIIGLILMVAVLSVLWFFNYRLSKEVRERKKVEERLRLLKEAADQMAYTDELSGLANRRAFYERGLEAMELAYTSHSPLSVILIDIDFFKKVNDQYGHLVGDQVIFSVANVILGTTGARDIQARIGGEEFAILLQNTTSECAMKLAEKVRFAIQEKAIVVHEQLIRVTASLGVTEYDMDNDDMNRFIQRADKALYHAKNTGRNRVALL